MVSAAAAAMLTAMGVGEAPGERPNPQRPVHLAEVRNLGLKLLARRDALQLTENQASEIQSLVDAVSDSSAPLRERLRKARGKGAGLRSQSDEEQRLVKQLIDTTATAMERLRSILTLEQKERAREILWPKGSTPANRHRYARDGVRYAGTRSAGGVPRVSS